MDISAIITLLLKDLDTPKKEITDPVAEDDEEPSDSDDTDQSEPDDRMASDRRWENIVHAIKPRLRRLINRLTNCLDEERSARWKYERVLVMLALLKRLRRWHPGTTIKFSGLPERLASDEHVRDTFKLAMRCWFARGDGVFAALDQMGGVDREHEIIGRALLLWAAYETGVDAAVPKDFNVDPEELRALQSDRTDALVAAIAASASSDTLERARRELFDRGAWHELRDRPERIEAWYNRHTKMGQAIQLWLTRSKPPSLPVKVRSPAVPDIVVWKQEPGWPRLPQMVSGRTVYLADVGDAEPLRIAQQFVQPVDIDVLGIRNLFTV